MNRNLIALLTALLLLLTSLPALAEVAGTAAPTTEDAIIPAPFVPVPEDFLGAWVPLYGVSDGELSSTDADMTGSTIHSDGTMTSVYGEGSFSYVITGDTLTVEDGTILQLVAPDLMVARSGNTSIVLQRTAAPATPFLGDWIPVTGAFGGEVVTRMDNSQSRIRFESASVVIVNETGEVTAPCVYAVGVCRIDADGVEGVASIDDAGLMTFSLPEMGLVYLLIRAK